MPVANVANVQLFYADDGQGEPILWLQGLGADHAAWSAQIFAFQNRWRCLRPDNRGVGQTRDTGGPFTTADLAKDLAGLLDHLGIAQTHLVGLSLGGAIAQSLALDHPDRVRSLVIAASFGRRDPWGDFLLRNWIDLHHRLGPGEFFRQALPWLVTEKTLADPARVENLINYAARSGPTSADFERQARAALAHDRLAELPRLRVPTLIVRGERDLLSPEWRGRELADAIPGARRLTIPDAGHLVNLENQGAFNAAVREHLRAATEPA